DAIWGRDTHVDFERGLNFCAAQIRGALRDSASSPRFIETIPRRGYRFIAPVRRDRDLPPERGRSFRGAAALLVIAVAAVALIARATSSSPPRIAVVPFDNETGSPDFDRIARSVSDATVVRLTTPERLPRFGIIGNAAALRFTFAPRDLQAMGRRLGAQFIVLGQVKRDERGFRIVAQLIRVSD